MRRLICPFFLIFSLCAWAMAKVTIEFPKEGKYQVWLAKTPSDPPPSGLTEFNGKTYEFDPSAPSQQLTTLVIRDVDTNNLAVKNLNEAGAKLTLKAADFALLASAVVHVHHGGKPVETAILTFGTGKEPNTRGPIVLAKENKGELTLYGLHPGPLRIVASYNSQGATKTLDPVIYELKLTRPQSQPVFSIEIPDPVSVVGESTTEPAAKGAEKASSTAKETSTDSGSPIGKLILMLVGVVVAIGAGYLLLRLLQGNEDKVKTQLEKLGVHVPDPADELPVPTTGQPAPPAPQEKIILGDPEPITPIGTAVAAAPVADAGLVANPRLVTASGDVLMVLDGTHTISRDPGVGIQVTDTTVSRKHAEIARSGDSVIVRDLGSTNGTYVNGVKITGDTPLHPGDQVQFGAAQFRYEV